MSLLRWFSSKKKSPAHGHAHSLPASSGLSRLDSTRPVHAPRHGATAQPANRKQERMARRELLYAVVRESMVRAGVLTSSYKFKVLSLDTRGRQFLVMVDLAQGASRETARLAEIEALIAQSAKARYDILVTAVYWRMNEHVAVGEPAHSPHQAHYRPATSRPMPLEASSQPAALSEHVSQPAELRAAPQYDPLHPDEVAAFRKALDAGVRGAADVDAKSRGEKALAAAHPHKAAQSYTLLTGFEDTEMADDAAPGEHLSATQYGALR
jgi:hypothetical protein